MDKKDELFLSKDQNLFKNQGGGVETPLSHAIISTQSLQKASVSIPITPFDGVIRINYRLLLNSGNYGLGVFFDGQDDKEMAAFKQLTAKYLPMEFHNNELVKGVSIKVSNFVSAIHRYDYAEDKLMVEYPYNLKISGNSLVISKSSTATDLTSWAQLDNNGEPVSLAIFGIVGIL